MMGHSACRVLIVDDENLFRRVLAGALVAAGYVVRTAVDGLDAIGQRRGGPADLIVSDLRMPRMSGYEFLAVEGTDPNKLFVEACREAKVKNVHWHAFRHTSASRPAIAGIPIRAIADLRGHAQIQTTARYAQLAPDYLAEAVERLAVPEGGQTDTAIDTREFEPSAKVG